GRSGIVGVGDRWFVIVIKCLSRNKQNESGSVLRPRLIPLNQQPEEGRPMLGATARAKSSPLLSVERGRRPSSCFKESHQLFSRDFLARHGPGRPAVEQQRRDGKICLSNFASFNHFKLISQSRAISISLFVK